MFSGVISTCDSSLQSRAMCSNHAWVPNEPWVSHSHIKGTSRNVASIELNIYGVNAILPWNEADCTLVWNRNRYVTFFELSEYSPGLWISLCATKDRLVHTTVQLSNVAFLRRARWGVDFGIYHTSSPISLHHEGGFLVYLQILLLQKIGKHMNMCVCALYVCVWQSLGGHKVCDSSCLNENRLSGCVWEAEKVRVYCEAFSVFALQADEQSYQT